MVREIKGYIDFNMESTNKNYLDESNLNTNTKFIAIMENYPPLMTMLEVFTEKEMANIYHNYVIEPSCKNLTLSLLMDEKMIFDNLLPYVRYITISKNHLYQTFSLLLLIHHNFHPHKVKRGYIFGTFAYNLYRCIAVLYKVRKNITNIMNNLCVTGSIFHELSKFDMRDHLTFASNLLKHREFRKYNPTLTYSECKKISSKVESNDSTRLIDQKINISKNELKVMTYLQRLNKQANIVVKFGKHSDLKDKKQRQLKLIKIAKAEAKIAEKAAKVTEKAAKNAEKEAKKAAKNAEKEAKKAAKNAEKARK